VAGWTTAEIGHNPIRSNRGGEPLQPRTQDVGESVFGAGRRWPRWHRRPRWWPWWIDQLEPSRADSVRWGGGPHLLGLLRCDVRAVAFQQPIQPTGDRTVRQRRDLALVPALGVRRATERLVGSCQASRIIMMVSSASWVAFHNDHTRPRQYAPPVCTPSHPPAWSCRMPDSPWRLGGARPEYGQGASRGWLLLHLPSPTIEVEPCHWS
jgi:hypothetical protein